MVSTRIPEVLASSASLPPALPSRQLIIMLPFSSAALCISIDLECALKIVCELTYWSFISSDTVQHEPPIDPLKIKNYHLQHNTINKGYIKFLVLTSQTYSYISVCVHIHLCILYIFIKYIYTHIYIMAGIYIYTDLGICMCLC